MRELHEIDRLRAGHVRPQRPVLICNPKSGGGKVESFGLIAQADDMGIEVVLLEPGLDLAQLARDAIARGADCLGMAGGDGSQALVASIAIEHNIPFVCISAGTRNHFALDLGLDRTDPRKGMIALRDGVERRVDFATVGDRLFVNNVSLGIYATIVQEDEYRDAKVETTKARLPENAGPPGRTVRSAVHHPRRPGRGRRVPDHGVKQPLRPGTITGHFAAPSHGHRTPRRGRRQRSDGS
jgi:hypothetical protein